MPDGRIPPQWWGSVLHRADSIAALAEATGIAPQALEDTVARFNGFARSGVDEDFARGQSAYDSVYCDKRHKPNPSLGEVARAPFYAVRLDLGDIGTMGGLLADENGQVIDRSGQPIAGLYAAGNCSSAFTGGTYPGAGATLGGAMTFAYLAANHLAALGDAAAIPQAIAERQPADLTA
jgi:3-oxosteroid 1-dehydrogenase